MFRKRAIFTALLLLAAIVPAFAQPYRVVDLGVVPGQTSSVPSDINNALQVVGLSGDQAFIWDPANALRPLGVTMGRAPQLNNAGVIAGVRTDRGGFELVALFNGVEYALPSPPGDTLTQVTELTDNNILLLRGTRTWAFASGQYFDLTTAFGGDAFAINEQGMVGGANAGGAYLRLSDGRVIQPWPTSFPVQLISAAGHFTGIGFYGFPDGAVIETPFRVIPATTNHFLYGINRAGDVVGSSFARFFESPFLYRAQRAINLGAMATGCDCNLISARAINDLGYIAAVAQFADLTRRAVVLVPIAPATPAGFSFALSNRTVTLTWQASAGALEYIVEAGRAPGSSELFNGSVGDTTSVTVTVPPGRYFVRLRAQNATGASAPTADLIIDVP